MEKLSDEQSAAGAGAQGMNANASDGSNTNNSNSNTQNQERASKEVESNNQITSSTNNISTSTESPAPSVAAPPSAVTDDFIRVRLMPIGNAPLLKNTKFNVSRKKKVLYFIEFLSKKIFKPPASNTASGAQMSTAQSTPSERIFIYCNNTFSPSPDQSIDDLYQSFKVGDELIICYSLSEAYG